MNQAVEFIKSRVLAGSILSITQLEEHVISYKSKIIEWAQKERKAYSFVVIEHWGKQHNMNFKIGLHFDDELIETGIGSSKKLAEEEASKLAFEKLSLQHD
jgi:ribonuclease-3